MCRDGCDLGGGQADFIHRGLLGGGDSVHGHLLAPLGRGFGFSGEEGRLNQSTVELIERLLGENQ